MKINKLPHAELKLMKYIWGSRWCIRLKRYHRNNEVEIWLEKEHNIDIFKKFSK